MSLLVGDIVRRTARRTPASPAVSLGDTCLTFQELDELADRTARQLIEDGVDYGDRVGWLGQPSVHAAALFVALARLGAVFIPLSTRLSPAELDRVIAKARLHHLLEELEAEVGTGKATDRPPPVFEAWLRETDPHVIFFTSGSTGAPKGVVLSHRASVLRGFPGYIPDPPGATVCMFPLFHMASWTIALGCWQAGHQVALVTSADPEELLDAVTRWRATRLYAIPAVWARILSLGVSGRDLSTLRQVDTGTSATPPELLASLKEAFPGTVTRVFYGSTEAGPGTVLVDHEIGRRPGSVGLPAIGVELRVTDRGEVCLRSDFLMDGYFEDDDASADALRDGWYHTGDAGTLDDDGYLWITGRLREVIRTGGETVAPREVEAILAEHPDVADVAVVGLPDAQWGEVVCAAIVARSGARLELADLRAHCEDRLAPFKHPRRLAIVDSLPRTAATGQIQRTLLVERLLSPEMTG